MTHTNLFNLAQRVKLFDEDRSTLSREVRDRWINDTAKLRKANEDMKNIFEKNKVEKNKVERKRFSLLEMFRP